MVGKFISFVTRTVARGVRIGVPVGLALGSIQLTSELGCWGRDPELALKRVKQFTGLQNNSS